MTIGSKYVQLTKELIAPGNSGGVPGGKHLVATINPDNVGLQAGGAICRHFDGPKTATVTNAGAWTIPGSWAPGVNMRNVTAYTASSSGRGNLKVNFDSDTGTVTSLVYDGGLNFAVAETITITEIEGVTADTNAVITVNTVEAVDPVTETLDKAFLIEVVALRLGGTYSEDGAKRLMVGLGIGRSSGSAAYDINPTYPQIEEDYISNASEWSIGVDINSWGVTGAIQGYINVFLEQTVESTAPRAGCNYKFFINVYAYGEDGVS